MAETYKYDVNVDSSGYIPKLGLDLENPQDLEIYQEAGGNTKISDALLVKKEVAERLLAGEISQTDYDGVAGRVSAIVMEQSAIVEKPDPQRFVR